MICKEGKLAIQCFTTNLILFLLVDFFCIYFNLSTLVVCFIYGILVLCINVVLIFINPLYDNQIAIRASMLGLIFALGVYVKIATPPYIQIFGGYMCTMAFFHFSEFVAISIVQPKEVSVNSFVINHSIQYTVAAVSSWIEFIAEAYFIPDLKTYYWISDIGLVICILGEVLRKVSMLTAGSSFNHVVIYEKPSDHKLVTHGVYAWFRHPSYVGWFYWSIGTQIILINPICIIAYTVASWLFFHGRIYLEELTLLNFYGQNYCDYQKKVWTGIPFVTGYQIINT